MKIRKMILSFSALAVATTTAVFIVTNKNDFFASAITCQHVGNHYLEKPATSSSYGIKEYWVCCNCHEHYIEEPSTGTWTDIGIANTSITSDDDRYIAPITSNIVIEGYTSTIKFGKPYKFDGKVYTVDSLGTKTLITSGYSVDYSNLNRFSVGESNFTVSYEDSIATGKINVVKSDELKILFIGNSFSVDTMFYGYEIANSMGIDNVKIGNLAIAGCSLATHWKNISEDNDGYLYYTYNSTWSDRGGDKTNKISDVIKSEDWDFISLQQASVDSGLDYSYKTYINQISNNLKRNCKNKNVQIVWNMTWAYQGDYENSGFESNYNSDQMTMYNGIVNAVKTKVVGNVSTIIPNGTAIQNFRTSYIGDNLTRDGLHLNLLYGRYTAGLTMVCALTGHTPDEAIYCPNNMSDNLKDIAIESSINALAKPFEITQSDYSELPNKKLENIHFYDSACYNVTASNGIKIQHLSSGADGFTCTQLLTKDQVPSGSIIMAKSGYQFRPERFDGVDKYASSDRLTNYDSLTISNSFWEDYKLLGFNVSRKDGCSISNFEEAHNSLEILVPNESYSSVSDVTYLTLTNVSTWSNTKACEIEVESLGTEVDATVFTHEVVYSLPSAIEMQNVECSNCEYAFSNPICKQVERNALIRVKNLSEDSIPTIIIKKNIIFTKDDINYAFDRDTTIQFIDNVWKIVGPVVLSVSDVTTWASGQLGLAIDYSDTNRKVMESTTLTATVSKTFLSATNANITSASFAFTTPSLATRTSRCALFKVDNVDADNLAIQISSDVIFVCRGVEYKFDKDYEIKKINGSWRLDGGVTYSISIFDIHTWSTGALELALNFSNEEFAFSAENILSTTCPNWIEVNNNTFANMVAGFPSPTIGEAVNQCLLIRFGSKSTGSTIKIIGGVEFKLGRYFYQFDKDYNFIFNGESWNFDK